jgi:hypothetical protein
MDEVNSKTVSIRDIFTSETKTLEQSESISKVLELCKKP